MRSCSSIHPLGIQFILILSYQVAHRGFNLFFDNNASPKIPVLPVQMKKRKNGSKKTLNREGCEEKKYAPYCVEFGSTGVVQIEESELSFGILLMWPVRNVRSEEAEDEKLLKPHKDEIITFSESCFSSFDFGLFDNNPLAWQPLLTLPVGAKYRIGQFWGCFIKTFFIVRVAFGKGPQYLQASQSPCFLISQGTVGDALPLMFRGTSKAKAF